MNREFDAVKKRIEIYLTEVVQKTQTKLFPSIQEAFNSIIDSREVAFGKQTMFVDSIFNKIITLGEDDAVQLDKKRRP